jgi:putative Mg2+ transporter-C (MgtC) family protein
MIDDPSLLFGLLPEICFKLAIGLLCGFLLGMEREVKGKPAGLRTIILITVGATLFMIVSDLVTLTTMGPEAITRVDPSRIASQVVSGIGFLGGGAIIQARGSVHGLTTAATIWVGAGIGLCIGIGFPLLSLGITLLVLGVLVVLSPVRAWLSQRGEHHSIELLLPNDALIVEQVKNVLGSNDLPRENFSFARKGDDRLLLHLHYNKGQAGKQDLLEELRMMEGVRGASLDESTLHSEHKRPSDT